MSYKRNERGLKGRERSRKVIYLGWHRCFLSVSVSLSPFPLPLSLFIFVYVEREKRERERNTLVTESTT